MVTLTQDGKAGQRLAVESQALLFNGLWAIAHFAHLLRKGDASSPFVWAVFVAAVLLLENPRSHNRLALLAAAQLTYLYTNLPSTDNHLIIMGFVNLGLLASVLLTRRGEDAPSLLPTVAAAPYVRLTIIIAYGAAAIAKLNHGFFDTATSCAVSMFHDALAVADRRMTLPEVPGLVEAALPFAIAAAELSVPLLLLIPATRLAGVGLVVAFHLAMSLSPSATAIDFTIVLFALVSLFLPAQAAARITGRWWRLSSRRAGCVELSRPVVFVLVTGVLAALIATDSFGVTTISGNRNWVVLAIAALVLGALLLESAWHAWKQRWPRAAPIWPAGTAGAGLRAVSLLCILVLAVNAASPYLGGKTKSVFTMYSNLRTEGVESNHFLIPRLPVETAQDDFVLVHESSNDRLDNFGNRDRFITWHELRRELAGDPDASITYERDGIVHRHENAHEDPELVTRDPVSHRFIAHRVYDPDRARCLW